MFGPEAHHEATPESGSEAVEQTKKIGETKKEAKVREDKAGTDSKEAIKDVITTVVKPDSEAPAAPIENPDKSREVLRKDILEKRDEVMGFLSKFTGVGTGNNLIDIGHTKYGEILVLSVKVNGIARGGSTPQEIAVGLKDAINDYNKIAASASLAECKIQVDVLKYTDNSSLIARKKEEGGESDT